MKITRKLIQEVSDSNRGLAVYVRCFMAGRKLEKTVEWRASYFALFTMYKTVGMNSEGGCGGQMGFPSILKMEVVYSSEPTYRTTQRH
jgi:hypothetical protein